MALKFIKDFIFTCFVGLLLSVNIDSSIFLDSIGSLEESNNIFDPDLSVNFGSLLLENCSLYGVV